MVIDTIMNYQMFDRALEIEVFLILRAVQILNNMTLLWIEHMSFCNIFFKVYLMNLMTNSNILK